MRADQLSIKDIELAIKCLIHYRDTPRERSLHANVNTQIANVIKKLEQAKARKNGHDQTER